MYLGFPLSGADGPPYAFPVIHDELERLEAELSALTGEADDGEEPEQDGAEARGPSGFGTRSARFAP